MVHLPPRPALFAFLLLATGFSQPATADAQHLRFDISAQSAAAGIAAFSRQATSVQLLVSQDAVRGRTTSRLRGTYRIESALTLLLRGSGLKWRRTGPTTYSLVATTPSKDSIR